MDKETKKEFESLGRMVKSGFDAAAQKSDIERLDKNIDDLDRAMDERLLALESKTDNGFKSVNARLFTIERDIAEIRSHFVYRHEFEDLMGRVKYLEQKLGIKSGK
jgi:hypothetical protein